MCSSGSAHERRRREPCCRPAHHLRAVCRDEPCAHRLANAIQRIRAAFPDFRYELLHEVAEGDMVVHHLVASGTQSGPFAGAGPSGRTATWREVHVMRFQAGRMAEQWGVVDRLSALQQLGLAPAPPAARPSKD